MNKIKCIVIDDEFPARENLAKLIATYCPNLEVIAKAGSVKEAKIAILSEEPDVVFLDINMPVFSGFDLLAEFPKRDFLVVITSAHSEFGLQAIKAEVIDYLLKPINVSELKSVSEKLESLVKEKLQGAKLYAGESSHSKLLISHSTGFSIIDIGTIIRLKGENNYTKLYLDGNNKILTVSKTIGDFEEVLPTKQFFRTHKSDIVNLSYLKEYNFNEGGSIVLTDGTQLSISRRRNKEFFEKIKELAIYLK
jgi:two-component system, LytTR family, response regulator